MFVTMLRKVRDCSSRTQAQIAKDGHIVATTLSNHLNGGRVPEEPQIRAFFSTVQQEVELTTDEALTLPCTLDDLLELRRLARLNHCDCVAHTPGGTPSVPRTPDESPAFPRPDPVPGPNAVPDSGTPPFGPRRRPRYRSRAVSRASVLAAAVRRRGPGPSAQVPVPPEKGDRPLTDFPRSQWTELETLTAFLSSGRERDAGLLLWRAGRTLSAPDLIHAVDSCRTAGLPEAAESLLSGVTERSDLQAVLNITAAFQHAGRHEDVRYLLAAAAH